MSTLIEYLEPFSQARDQSQWLIPAFSTVIANMYWAHATTLNGFNTWGSNKTIFVDPNPNATQRSEIYYLVDDEHVVWELPSMNTSWMLYFVFAIEPTLTVLIFYAAIIMYRIPIGRGFGLIALLAGVRIENLKLLEGASFSGALKKPLRVRIAVGDLGASEHGHPRIEYSLGDKRRNGSLPRSQRHFPAFGLFRAWQKAGDAI